MRKLTVFFTTVILILGAFSAQYSFPETDGPGNEADSKSENKSDEPSLDQILDSYYNAIGGLETWKSLDSIVLAGKMNSLGTRFEMKAAYKRDDMCRIDYEKGKILFVEAFDGQVVWHKNPFTTNNEPRELSGERAAEVKETCEFDSPLVNYKSHGHEVEYLGRVKDGDREAYNLKITFRSGNVDNYFIDTGTYLPYKIVGTTTIQDKTVNSTTLLENYMETGDIVIPYEYVFEIEGIDTNESFYLTTVEINPELEDSFFRMPRDIKDSR